MNIIHGIDILVLRRGIAYEGNLYGLWAIHPRPAILHARGAKFQSDDKDSHEEFVFLEDSFDLASQVRRGRFYGMFFSRLAGYSWAPNVVENDPYGALNGVSSGDFNYDAIGFISHSAESVPLLGSSLSLGTDGYEKAYYVIGVEKNIFGQQVFTLKGK